MLLFPEMLVLENVPPLISGVRIRRERRLRCTALVS
jgi:hypothetical protein